MLSRDFYFLRHGETDWNVIKRLQGHTDIPLNENGRTQARSVIETLKTIGLQRIISSPLSRAYETATIVNEILQIPLQVDDRLKEKHFGLYEGKTGEDIKIFHAEYPDITAEIEPETNQARPPEGEVYKVFHDRIFDGIKQNLVTYPDEKILFVSHGGVYRGLCRHLIGDTDHSPNAQPFHFRMETDKWVLQKIT